MHHIEQCIGSYLAEATGTVARGVAAAGLDISLPADIGRFAAFVDELSLHMPEECATLVTLSHPVFI